MLLMPEDQQRQGAARQVIDDIGGALTRFGEPIGAASPQLGISKKRFLTLLTENFNRIDLDDNGISRKELEDAFSAASQLTRDEAMMLRLLQQYFDTIAGMADDLPGDEETRVTKLDVEVLAQFLLNSNMSLDDLHKWCSLASANKSDRA
jgi:hypothetical protein